MSEVKNSEVGYSKQAIVAIFVAMPMVFGLNIPLDLIVSIQFWQILLINAVVVSAYMTFMVPKATKFVFSRLKKHQVVKNED